MYIKHTLIFLASSVIDLQTVITSRCSEGQIANDIRSGPSKIGVYALIFLVVRGGCVFSNRSDVPEISFNRLIGHAEGTAASEVNYEFSNCY